MLSLMTIHLLTPPIGSQRYYIHNALKKLSKFTIYGSVGIGAQSERFLTVN